MAGRGCAQRTYSTDRIAVHWDSTPGSDDGTTVVTVTRDGSLHSDGRVVDPAA